MTNVSETSRRLGPLRKVAQHLGPDDRLECGHIVPAWGLIARRRRCHWCRSEWLSIHSGESDHAATQED